MATDKLELNVGQEFANFGQGVFDRIPLGAAFALRENGTYIYDPFFAQADKGCSEWVVRVPYGWASIATASVYLGPRRASTCPTEEEVRNA